MTTAVSLLLSLGCKVTKTITPTTSGVGPFQVIEDIAPRGSVNLDGTTTPAVGLSWVGDVTLSGGVATLDLTALPAEDPTQVVVDLTTKKIKAIKIVADAANSSTVTLVKGAVNGLAAFIGAGNIVELGAGDAVLFSRPASANMVTVDSTHKTIDIASGMGAAKLSVQIVAG